MNALGETPSVENPRNASQRVTVADASPGTAVSSLRELLPLGVCGLRSCTYLDEFLVERNIADAEQTHGWLIEYVTPVMGRKRERHRLHIDRAAGNGRRAGRLDGQGGHDRAMWIVTTIGWAKRRARP